MRLFESVAIAVIAVMCSGSAFAGPENCAKLKNDVARLACYDSLFGKPAGTAPEAKAGTGAGEEAPSAAPSENWTVTTGRSKMTDQRTVFLSVESNKEIPDRFGLGSGPARLLLRCMENKTAVLVTLNGHFLADIQGYGRVQYRIDEQKMRTVSMAESTDNKALGLWSGGRAIPFIKSLGGHHTLIMRITPFNESSYTVTFNISGLEAVLPPLKEACH